MDGKICFGGKNRQFKYYSNGILCAPIMIQNGEFTESCTGFSSTFQGKKLTKHSINKIFELNDALF